MSVERRSAVVSLVAVLIFTASLGVAASPKLLPSPLVAHAGGEIRGEAYTNSLEALDANYERGHRFFEIDLSWSSDEELVAIHDWQDFYWERFDVPPGAQVPTKAEFLRLKTRSGLTPLSLGDILQWAAGKGDAFIITDVKENNLQALQKIGNDCAACRRFVVPQVYFFQEYDEAINLGFDCSILTLYRMKIDPVEVLAFARKRSPFAVAMPWQVARAGLAALLQRNGIVVYAHTINDPDLLASLRAAGVFGIYTDSIAPDDLRPGR